MDEDRVLDKVRKLLAKAENTTHEAERDALNEKAAALIAAYGIDRARLAHAGKIRDEVTSIKVNSGHPLQLRQGVAVGGYRRCVAVQVGAAQVRADHRVCDCDGVRVRFRACAAAVHEFVVAGGKPVAARATRRARGDGTRAYRISWMLGCRGAVYRRLVEAERVAAERDADRAVLLDAATSGEPGTALVLVGRNARVTALYEEMFPKLGKARKRRYGRSGYEDGQKAGQRADLGATTVHGGRREIEQ